VQTAAADGRWRQGGHATIGHDSNPANVSYAADERAALVASGGLRLDHDRALGMHSRLLWRTTLDVEAYERHQDLTQAKLGGQLRLSTRGDGFYSPLLALWVSAAYAEYGSRIRSGSEFRLGASVQEHLTTRIGARLGTQVSSRQARGRAFDLTAWSLALDLDWRPLTAWTIYTGYQFRDGDLVSTSVPRPMLITYAEAVEYDDAFGPGEYAYRLDARSDIVTLGLNYACSPGLALDLQWQTIDAQAAGGQRYERDLASLGVLLRF
jgi:hypothetical protein